MRYLPILIVAIALGGCGGYPRVIDLPFDNGGESPNSPALELTPEVRSRYIVFASDRRGSQDIYLYDRAAGELVPLPGLNALDAIASQPSVSEDGNYIAFENTRRGVSDIYLYVRETRVLRNLTANLSADVRNPTISADGSTIAYQANTNGRWDLFVSDRQGQLLDLP